MKDSQFSFFIVAWLDLLAQRREVLKSKGIPKTDEEKIFFYKPYINVLKFRERIKNLHNILSKPLNLDKLKSKLSAEQIKMLEKYVTPKLSFQFIGDAALLKINLLDSDKESRLLSIERLVQELSILMLTFLAEGIPIRGAIDADLCTEIAENDLYGRAVTRAYTLESEYADYPRIMVTPNFLNYLTSCEKEDVNDNKKIIDDHYVNSIRSMIIDDPTDNFPIVSYLTQKPDEHYEGQEDNYKECVRNASHFIFEQIKKHKESCNIKLLSKYEKLRIYFKSQNYWE